MRKGYLRINICGKMYFIHRLVAISETEQMKAYLNWLNVSRNTIQDVIHYLLERLKRYADLIRTGSIRSKR